RKLPPADPVAGILAARGSVERALETLDRPLHARRGRLRARGRGLGPRRRLLGSARRRIVAVRTPGQRDQQRRGGGRPPAHRVTLGGAREGVNHGAAWPTGGT